jgi:tetratricopeptide (TPR) repeat protein
MLDKFFGAPGRAILLGAVCLFGEPLLLAADQAWELRGEVLAVGADGPKLVELRLRDGSTVKVPLDAFSERSQAAILSAGAAGKPTKKPVAEGSRLAALDEAVSRCKTAEDALRALKLCLAGEGAAEGIPPADAAAAVARWEERAKRGEVRLGSDWVPPAVAASAAEAGDDLVKKLATMVGLGNFKLFREYLEKASKVDPNSGRADFLLGVAAASGVGLRADNDKAIRYFAEVVGREPWNGVAWNNLAVCEIRARRFDDALAHFMTAADCLDNPQFVVANVGLMVGAGNLTAKQAEAFAAVYERLVPTQDGQRVTPPPQSGLSFLSPFGQPIAGQVNFAEFFVAPAGGVIERVGGGMVVAPAVVLVPSESLFSGGSHMVRSAAEPTIDRPAQVIATSQGLGITLLRCDGLTVEPMALAAACAPAGSDAIVVPPAGRARWPASPGTVVALDVLPGVFVHTAAGLSRVVGVPLMDSAGTVIGLTASTPQFNQPGTPRAFGTPIERVWPFLKDHLPDLEPAEAADVAKSWEKLASDASRRMVTVVARPAP